MAVEAPEAQHTSVRPITDAERQTVSVPDACRILGVSRPVGYALIKRGEFPVPVIRLGRRIVVSKRALDALLGGTTYPEQDAA